MTVCVSALSSWMASDVRAPGSDGAVDVHGRPPATASLGSPARADLFGWLRLAAVEGPASEVLPQVAELTPRPGSAAAIEAPVAGASKPAAATDPRLSERLLALVNQRRVAAGLLPVATEPHLAAAAGAYALEMAQAGWFSHTGPRGSTLLGRVTAAGLAFDAPIGEVIWRGGPTPEAIVQAWLDSPSHRAQILGAYGRGGAGCAVSGQQAWCVIDLAG